ncbi:hypothetical protein [Oceanobacillus limi]|nr:hypothetical protein [Oceanobacillus limi]
MKILIPLFGANGFKKNPTDGFTFRPSAECFRYVAQYNYKQLSLLKEP